MNRQEVLDFVKETPFCNMATVEDGEPRVRGMMTAIVDERGLLFSTGTPKAVWQQILAQPKIELCYYNPEKQIQLRVRGEAKVVKDMDEKKAVVEKYPFLQQAIDMGGYDILSLCRIESGATSTWTAADPMKPSEWETF
ncbi:MAG: pyridoxamine 5'-phosphate oxidase family protein [Candidatus Sumerlaeia bacterium]